MENTIATLLAIAAGCTVVGAAIDRTLSAPQKTWLYSQLEPAVRRRSATTVATLFLTLFDHLFQTTRLHRPRFWRSVVASGSALAAMSALWYLSNPGQAKEILGEIIASWDNLFGYAAFVVSLNVLVDFLSLWETRLILDRMAAPQPTPRRTLWLLLDLMLTLLSFFVVFYCTAILVTNFTNWGNFGLDPLPILIPLEPVLFSRLLMGMTFLSGVFPFNYTIMDPFRIFLYTSLFPSFWAWTFMAGIVLWSVFKPVLALMGQLRERPVTCVMTAGGLCLSCLLALYIVARALSG